MGPAQGKLRETHLKTSGDGSKLVVCCLRISSEVIPTSKCLPTEIKAGVISATFFIGIAGHTVE